VTVTDFNALAKEFPDKVRLDGQAVDVTFGDALLSCDEELTIDGSPVVRIGVLDPRRLLTRSRLFDHDGNGRLDRPVRLTVDGVRYRLSGLQKQSDTYTLTFEDETVALLRNQRGTQKLKKGRVGHVAFARQLVGEVKARIVTGDPGPIELRARRKSGLRVRAARAEADERREPGVGEGERITVGDRGTLGPEELRNVDTVLGLARRYRAGPKATLALVEACIVEPAIAFQNTRRPSSEQGDWAGDSYGILQARLKYVPLEKALDVEYCVTRFLKGPAFTGGSDGAIALERKNPTWEAWEIAQKIEGSGHPERYDQYRADAERIIRLFGGGDLVASSAGGRRIVRIPELSRGTPENRDEDSWTALGRIAESYGYRCFAFRNAVYYMSDETLMRSRSRLLLSEETPGVEWIDWEWSPRKIVNSADVSLNVLSEHLPIGSVVKLDEDCKPADGRWLVRDYSRSLFSPTAQVQLIRGGELLRPKIPTEEIQARLPKRSGSPAVTYDAPGVPANVAAAYAKAVEISRARWPYVYGGGHGRAGVASASHLDDGVGFDCSSYTVAQLAAGEMGFKLNEPGVPASGALRSWGDAGEGRWMTVWTNDGHVWVQYKIRGAAWRADTGQVDHRGYGPHIRDTPRSSAGFVARHWPGT
jgi:hypothetical protein